MSWPHVAIWVCVVRTMHFWETSQGQQWGRCKTVLVHWIHHKIPNNLIFISFSISTNVELEKCFYSGFTAFLYFFFKSLNHFFSYLLKHIDNTHNILKKEQQSFFYALELLSPGYTSTENYTSHIMPHYETLQMFGKQ